MNTTVAAWETTATAAWRGEVCPRCGNMVAEHHQVVLCPKCSTPNHVECWRGHGGACGVCGEPAELREDGGPVPRAAPPSAHPGSTAAVDTAEPLDPLDPTAAPNSPAPQPPTPSIDTVGAALHAQQDLGRSHTGRVAGSLLSRRGNVGQRILTALRAWASGESRRRLWPQPARPRLEWMLPPARVADWGTGGTTGIVPGMTVCDSSGTTLGVVARIYAPSTPETASETPETAPEGVALLELRARGQAARRSKPLYMRASAVHDVRGMTVWLWRAGEALANDVVAPSPAELARLRPRASIPAPVYRPVLEWR